MSIKDEYLEFKAQYQLRTNKFDDRVTVQKFLRDRLEDIWAEGPHFTNGGLLSNYMTQFAIGFAYYDCTPSSFCKTRCYGLPIKGVHDYYMLRLGVITSESLKTDDPRFMRVLSEKIKDLKCLEIGHWGDAVLEQVPTIIKLVKENSNTIFWWYTKKKDIALAVNNYNLPNL
ncbi:MAG: hypothetical protein EFT35_07680 [Methanophagales archaeon ANME-1-THS]|nr:MAG: hypothetical protein EFT35_07680 [Methanophagales archaeon ANME-1-THS]